MCKASISRMTRYPIRGNLYILFAVYLLKTWRVFGKREIIVMLLIFQYVVRNALRLFFFGRVGLVGRVRRGRPTGRVRRGGPTGRVRRGRPTGRVRRGGPTGRVRRGRPTGWVRQGGPIGRVGRVGLIRRI